MHASRQRRANGLRHAVVVAFCSVAAASCTTGDEEASEPGVTAASETAAETTDAGEVAPQSDAEPSNTEASTAAAPDGESAGSTSSTSKAAPDACGLEVGVSFRESAPRDSMTILNEAASQHAITAIDIDLANSAGSIIFDTVEGGTGVEVFQDFQVEGGEAVLRAEPAAEDGGTTLRLEFSSFEPAQSFTFSIDVDDQLVDSDLGQIQVTGDEIAGATVTIEIADGARAQATFDGQSTAAFLADC